MKQAIKTLHLAAQYLSAAGINYVDKKTDDSHTNLGWDPINRWLITHPFGLQNNHKLALEVINGILHWLDNDEVVNSLDLRNSNHSNSLEWIRGEAAKRNLPPYDFSFHYDLPYEMIGINSAFVFDPNANEALSKKWTIGKKAFERFLKANERISPIRIWSHHFDLGIYTQLDTAGELFMGAGLAIPDTLEDEMYFYASGWKKGNAVSTDSFQNLSVGRWRSDWNGATLSSLDIHEEKIVQFLTETMTQFLQ